MRVATLVALMLALASSGAAAAAPISAVASVDRNAITIGDPIALTIVVDADPGYQVVDPGVARVIGDFEVLETGKAAVERRGNGSRISFRYRISTYSLGDHLLPPIEVVYTDPAGTRGTVRTAELVVGVVSIVLSGEDTSDVKPLKPPMSLPGGIVAFLARVALFALALAVAAATVTVAVVVARRRMRVPEEVDGRTPVRRALDDLETLAGKRLADQGRLREQYETLGRTLRRYVVDRYELAGPGRTARELRGELERRGLDQASLALITEILREDESVRFGRFAPYPAHANGRVKAALELLKRASTAEEYELEQAAGAIS